MTVQARERSGRRAVVAVVLAVVLVATGCEVAIDRPGNTTSIEKVDEVVTADGWRYEYFRNLAYPCSLSGHQTFVIGTRLADADSAVRPLWVRMRGGGSGWFAEDGTVKPNKSAIMTEEAFGPMRNRLRQNGLGGRINDHEAGFRGLSVSMCNRDTYGGSNNPDPNNFDSEGNQRRTNGLLATKAAIEFTLDRHPTSDYFLHGGSAGSVGTYHVSYAMERQGLPPAGIVADGGIRNDDWEAARLTQGTCSSLYGSPEWYEAFGPRVHSELREPESQPHELVASGSLTVPIVQLWSQGDPTSCSAIEMACPLPGGAVTMGATDCKNEPLRAAIEDQGPDGRSLSLGVCVTNAGSDLPCDVHVSSRLDLENTNPAHPADYLSVIVDWVDDRLAETDEGVLGAGFACPWPATDTRRHTFLVAGEADTVAVGAEAARVPPPHLTGDERLRQFDDGAWRPLIPDGDGSFGPEISFA